MQPPFDLNLMTSFDRHDPQELMTKAETARMMAEKRGRAKLTLWRRLRSVWAALKEGSAINATRLQS